MRTAGGTASRSGSAGAAASGLGAVSLGTTRTDPDGSGRVGWIARTVDDAGACVGVTVRGSGTGVDSATARMAGRPAAAGTASAAPGFGAYSSNASYSSSGPRPR